MMGLPRSGKSTLAEKSAEQRNGIVVSSDWIREHILGQTYFAPSNAIVWSMIDSTLRILLSQGQTVILDGINLTKETRKFYVDLGREYGAKIEIVYCKTPLFVCLDRNSKDHKIPDEQLSKLSRNIEVPSADEFDEYSEYCFSERK